MPSAEQTVIAKDPIISTRERILVASMEPYLEEVMRPPYVMDLLHRLTEYSPWTAAHCVRVGAGAVGIYEALDSPPAIAIPGIQAAFLHDVGKTRTPKSVLDKKGALTESEFMTMQGHAEEGYDLVLPHDKEVAAILVGHHAHQGDRSYPASEVSAVASGARSPEVIMQQKILAVVDTVDALVAKRPYQKWGQDEVRMELDMKFGEDFPPRLLDNAVLLGRQLVNDIRV